MVLILVVVYKLRPRTIDFDGFDLPAIEYATQMNMIGHVSYTEEDMILRAKRTLKPDLGSHRAEPDFFEYRYIVHSRPFSYVMHAGSVNTTLIIDGQRTRNKIYLPYNDVSTPRLAMIHRPTVDHAGLCLHNHMFASWKRFRLDMNGRRYKPSERSFFFGQLMVEKVMAHLNGKSEYQYNSATIAATAECVVLEFYLQHGITMPIMSFCNVITNEEKLDYNEFMDTFDGDDENETRIYQMLRARLYFQMSTAGLNLVDGMSTL
jgi:hypothetical protein